MINRRIPAMAFAALLAMSAAFAAHANTQHTVMKQCNTEAKAKSLAGAERQQFMKSCLSTRHAPRRTLSRQQQRMKTCNVSATSKGLKGAERRKFMSACLKG